MTTTPRPPIIGLLGRAQSGKDTLAGFLVYEHGFTRYAFADRLKAAALGADPFIEVGEDEPGIIYGPGITLFAAPHYMRLSDVVAECGWEQAKKVREVRRLLQRFGQSMRNNVDPDVWAAPVLREAQSLGRPVVFTDVRFLNEVTALREADATLARVVRPNRPSIHGAEDVSETQLDDYPVDLWIVNDGTIDDLRDEALHLVHVATR